MSLSFPRAFPLTRFNSVSLTLQRRQAGGVVQSGADTVIDRGQPAWIGSWTTNELTDAEGRQWDAWLASLRGASRFFLGYDTQRTWPLAYPGGAGAPGGLSGTFTLTAIGGARDLATLGALTDGATLNPGDHVSLVLGTRYSLHAVIDAAPVVASGGALQAQLDPEMPAWITTSAVVRLQAAVAKFRLLKRPQMVATGDGGPRPWKPLTIDAISTSQ